MSRITNSDLYNAITSLRLEIKSDVKELRQEVDANTNWRNQITGKITVLVSVIGIGVNWLWDLFVNRS